LRRSGRFIDQVLVIDVHQFVAVDRIF